MPNKVRSNVKELVKAIPDNSTSVSQLKKIKTKFAHLLSLIDTIDPDAATQKPKKSEVLSSLLELVSDYNIKSSGDKLLFS